MSGTGVDEMPTAWGAGSGDAVMIVAQTGKLQRKDGTSHLEQAAAASAYQPKVDRLACLLHT
jgi:hypothetical protein